MHTQHIDFTNLERLFKGNRARIDEWMRLYVEESPAYFKQLSDSLITGDAEAMASAAHDLRPQAHYLGAARMLELLIAIEDHARNQRVAACKDLVAEALALKEGVDNDMGAMLGRPENR